MYFYKINFRSGSADSIRNQVRVRSLSKRQTGPRFWLFAREGLVLSSSHSKEGNRIVHRIPCPLERCWKEKLPLGTISGISTKERQSSVISGESWPVTERADPLSFLSETPGAVCWKEPRPGGWTVGGFCYLPAWQRTYNWKPESHTAFLLVLCERHGDGRRKREVNQTIK